MSEFSGFPKIPRLSRDMVVTEKIDGTNASVWVGEDGSVRAGCRTRFITPEDDNFGFAAWVRGNADDLLNLGVGAHYGEWWGKGINRNYGQAGKQFSLFNVERWELEHPKCCGVVPVLYRGVFSTAVVNVVLDDLRIRGSVAVPGFMDPEGVVVWHEAARVMFKKTLKIDEKWKGAP